METSNQPEKLRWGQGRRLEFIDLRLQFDGRINRGDLRKFFNISIPQASADLGQYQTLAPANMTYDSRHRVYVALPDFKPFFGEATATQYLDEIQRIARKVVPKEESFIGFLPPTGIVDTPARAIEAGEVAVLVRAIRDHAAVRVTYQSMNHTTPSHYVLSPHAFGFDGLRWHVRAWCHTRKVFRDFAIGRLEVEGLASDIEKIDPSTDMAWNQFVPVVLVPHPALSPSQRKYVVRDYGMEEESKTLRCRQAMLFYTLRHLNLEELSVKDDPARQHVVIQNPDEVARWIKDDRPAGT